MLPIFRSQEYQQIDTFMKLITNFVFLETNITVKLGYNEQLGTGNFCSLTTEFVITEFHCIL
jgi:hypothetical protein